MGARTGLRHVPIKCSRRCFRASAASGFYRPRIDLSVGVIAVVARAGLGEVREEVVEQVGVVLAELQEGGGGTLGPLRRLLMPWMTQRCSQPFLATAAAAVALVALAAVEVDCKLGKEAEAWVNHAKAIVPCMSPPESRWAIRGVVPDRIARRLGAAMPLALARLAAVTLSISPLAPPVVPPKMLIRMVSMLGPGPAGWAETVGWLLAIGTRVTPQ